MEKQSTREDLIAALAQDMTPVERVKPAQGAGLIAFATLVAGVACIAIFEFWTGMVTGEASAFYWITNGLLLLLGAASTSGVVASALPRVGSRGNAPYWSAAMLAVVPIAAIITVVSLEANHDHSSAVPSVLADPATWYWECGLYGTIAGGVIALASVLYLRRGAPVSLERSGWLTGLAAGSLGALAYNITCPLDTVAHVGIWHTIPVLVWAVLGRLVVPPLIRW
ncbi:MAG: DUF1109 domain-containing protein [Erythrobacter sp.]|uniref:DUF1109 domain-containing protein n=1 Tax=Erythrobacter sp. TaxID=1042 RepID=UPI00260E9752|nr:DUF1109 domain-containing protein [Erythrobacter sp.]MDJ0979281.1 DUF1109 domain-containing protein [Erythrobacter sp.]